MINLTIHHGTHEIGGSCIELRTDSVKILIDFGLPLDFDKRSEAEKTKILQTAAVWAEGADAVFLSHSHADHYGLFRQLPAGTKVYATEETFEMLALDGIFGKNPMEHLEQCPLRCYKTYDICGMQVRAYPVDHSAYGACAYMFEIEGKRLLYSGDIRLHGVKGALMRDLPKEVDYTILEGTNVSRAAHCPSERDIEQQFAAVFLGDPSALYMVWCTARNIDRICRLFRACLRCGRTLVIDPYTANVLSVVAKMSPSVPTVNSTDRIKVYFPHEITARLDAADRTRYIFPLQPSRNKVRHSDISAAPERYVMLVRPSLVSFLRKIKAPDIKLITSVWSGYWNEMSSSRFRNWAENHTTILPDIHTSGHADTESLQKIVEYARPRTLIPVHTDSPEQFAELFHDCNVVSAEDGKSIAL